MVCIAPVEKLASGPANQVTIPIFGCLCLLIAIGMQHTAGAICVGTKLGLDDANGDPIAAGCRPRHAPQGRYGGSKQYACNSVAIAIHECPPSSICRAVRSMIRHELIWERRSHRRHLTYSIFAKYRQYLVNTTRYPMCRLNDNQ